MLPCFHKCSYVNNSAHFVEIWHWKLEGKRREGGKVSLRSKPKYVLPGSFCFDMWFFGGLTYIQVVLTMTHNRVNAYITLMQEPEATRWHHVPKRWNLSSTFQKAFKQLVATAGTKMSTFSIKRAISHSVLLNPHTEENSICSARKISWTRDV